MISITTFQRATRPDDGTIASYTTLSALFDDHFLMCREVADAKAKLDSPGFVAAPLANGPNGKPQRLASNLGQSRLAILDVDKTSEYPENIHAILCSLNIDHILHTTWSHAPDSPRCRIIIPLASAVDIQGVRAVGEAIIGRLQAAGLDVAYATENAAPAQLWFFPCAVDPSIYRAFIHDTGCWYAAVDAGTQQHQSGATDPPRAKRLHKLLSDVRTHEDIHASLLNLTYQMVCDGVPDAWIQTVCSDLLGPARGDKRVEARRGEIARMIKGAHRRIEAEAPPDESPPDEPGEDAAVDSGPAIAWHQPGQEQPDPPRPPGTLGELIDQALAMQVYHNPHIATASALGLICGIAGYCYQTPGPGSTGCNEYVLVSMRTGGGKDFISKFITSALRRAGGGARYAKFYGPKSYTGGKALRKALTDSSCMVSVITEMGQLLGQSSGDQTSLRRVMLDLYSRSGEHDVVAAECYSHDSDRIPPLAHPALTLIGEGEPRGFIRALTCRDSVTDGFAPRCLMLRADTTNRPYAKAPAEDWDPGLVARLSNLCNIAQRMCPPTYMEWESDGLFSRVMAHERHWTDQCNAFHGVDPAKEALATRAHMHAVKLATACAAADQQLRGDDAVILHDDWDWAVAMVQHCFDAAQTFLGLDAASLADGAPAEGLGDVLILTASTLRKYFTSPQVGAQYRRDAYASGRPDTVQSAVMEKLLRRNPDVKRLASARGATQEGYDILLAYCLRNGYLKQTEHKRKVYYTATERLNELLF